ncbi:MAG TPA: Hpt domain-containing protein [Candidatus Wallbacteria bacterium]|nr:Hpt domain-containing protein [Candidatus Wallbacteria bacterium]
MQKIIFDRDGLTVNMGGMEDLVKGSVEVFLEFSPQFLSKIKNSIDLKNMMDVRLNVHSLKGSALNSGATAIVETLKKIEALEPGDKYFAEAECLFIELENDYADYAEEVKKQGLI